jgi:hypothetical protein
VDESLLVDPEEDTARAWFAEIVEALPFELVLAWRWRRGASINVCEFRARNALAKYLARRPEQHGKRHLAGFDSLVTIGASAKGRSSAVALNHEARKGNAHLLAADLYIGGLWTDTKRMPSDYGSRGDRAVPVPAPARPWVHAFLQGDVKALDKRLGL